MTYLARPFAALLMAFALSGCMEAAGAFAQGMSGGMTGQPMPAPYQREVTRCRPDYMGGMRCTTY